MSKILIIGNSMAVIKAIEQIRAEDKQSSITLFCTESLLPYDRKLLPSFVAGQVKEAGTQPVLATFFKDNQVEIVANEKLLRISSKRRYITTESKLQIEFDQLMVSDLGLIKPLSVKGSQKKGVFNSLFLSNVKDLMKYLPFADTIFVMVSNLQGFNMACALHGLGKEVVMVCSERNLLQDFFDEETGVLLKQIVEGKGIRVLADNTIEEVLGDAEMKAVKLHSGKVVGAQMLVYDFVSLDMRLIEDENSYVRIDDEFFHAELPLPASHFGFKVLDGFAVGHTKLPESGREYLKFDGPQNVFKKAFAKDDFFVGSVLFNAPSHEAKMLKIISDRISVSGQEEMLLGG